MAHVIYPYELSDPDFSWLLSNFLEQHPNSVSIEVGNLPVVLLSESDVSEDEASENNDLLNNNFESEQNYNKTPNKKEFNGGVL